MTKSTKRIVEPFLETNAHCPFSLRYLAMGKGDYSLCVTLCIVPENYLRNAIAYLEERDDM